MRLFKTAFISFFTIIFLSPVSSKIKAQQKTITIQPKKPAPGDTATITYHPDSPDAAIKSPDSLKLVFSFDPHRFSQPDKFDMKKTVAGWVAVVPLSKQFDFGSFYFKSGQKTDKNMAGHQYELFVYKNDTLVKGAYLDKARGIKTLYPKASKKKTASMRAHLYKKELNLYPDNYDAQMKLYAYQLKRPHADSAAILEKTHKRINQKLAEAPGSWEVISDVKSGYRQIGEKARGDSVEKAVIKKYPHSDVAMLHLYQEAMKKKDKNKQAQLLKKYIDADYKQSYINIYYTWRAYGKLFKYYAKKDSVEQMKQIARLWLQPNPRMMKNPRKANDYNAAAIFIAKNNVQEQYDWAKQLVRKALQLSKNEPVSYGYGITKYGIKLTYLPEEKAKKQRKYRKANILATLGLIYTKQSQYDNAEMTLKKAVKLSNKNIDANKYLAALYQQTNRPKKAFDIYRSLLMKKPTDKDLQEKLKKSYIAYKGSEEGFKEQTQKINEAWHKKMVKKFAKERINKDAPSLAHATNLKGAPLDTTTLQGKVVVLDFWATWCGPCQSSFPHLQKVYEKFKNNSAVKFVILDSGWNNTLKQENKWIKKQDYSFPYYFDKDSKITTAFGVRGIPTTFVIGKNNRIQFKDVGYSGPSMEKKLALKIEMELHNQKTTANLSGNQ
jgi:thiol-disulfide isomerase/thioredoxin